MTHLKTWTQDRDDFLREHYPRKGKMWCVQQMGLTEPQVRSRASTLGLKARGVSEAWLDGQIRAAASKVGKKRPDQAEVMRRVNANRKPISDEQRLARSLRLKNWISVNGHPRGHLGMTHSDEARAKMSESGNARVARETEDQKTSRIVKGMQTRSERGIAYNTNRANASWKAGWRDIGGKRKYFRSRWEANYARYLELLKAAGEITEWEHEPETFWFDGIKRGCMSYLPDFRVTNQCGKVEYHEVKGWMDDRSKTKIKRMAKYHPEVTLIVIEKKQYTEIKNKTSRLIAGWE